MARQLMSIFLFLASVLALAGDPILEFDTTHVDLGRVDPGSKVEVRFKFHNKGTAPLEIQSIKPG